MVDTDEPHASQIVIYASRLRLLWLLSLDVLFGFATAVLLFLWWWGEIRSVLAPLFGTLGVAGALLVGPYLVYRLIVRRPALIINPEGIFDNASMLSAGLIRWDEIDEISVHSVRGQTFLGIMPTDVERVLARQPFIKRALMRANMGLGAPPINVPQSVLRIRARDLATQVARVYGVQLGADS